MNVRRPVLLAGALVLVAIIGLIDYLTNSEISFSIFYLIPISVAAWSVGLAAGLLMAFLGAIAWLFADLQGTSYSNEAIPYWNASVRLGIFVIIAVVLSSRRKAQERILRLMRVKSEFTATVSHELRTPLTSIQEGISLVLDGTVGDLNERQKECLDTAKRNVDRLARLLNDVLSFQQLEEGRITLRLQPCEIGALVEEMVEAFRLSAQNRALELSSSLDPDLPTVVCDHDRVRQVLANLLHNAIKYTPRGRIEVTAVRDGDGVRVSVRDEGVGIPLEDQPKLFQRFTQLPDGSRQGIPSGTGLGLVIANAIVEEHGGNVGLDSAPGRGSTFFFTLPVTLGAPRP